MTTKYGKIFFSIAGVVLMAFFSSRAWAESILGEEWEKFFKEKVSFGGFVENTSGVSVGAGSHFFNTSNRFVMNRFTIQPEFNVDMAEWAKFFISWRFVAEPRYSMETKSREASVTYFPPQPVRPLIVTYYSEYSPGSLGSRFGRFPHGPVEIEDRQAIYFLGRNRRHQVTRCH